MSARAQLLAGGMNRESVLQVVGMADRAPLDTKRADAGVNRRIELLILTTARPRPSPPCLACRMPPIR
jgi:chemotaxis protein MotB